MEPRTSQCSGQVRAKTNHGVVGMDPMTKQTHLVSSLIRDVPTGLSHEDSAATGRSTNQTIHTSSDSATLQSGWIGCNTVARRFLKELSNVSEVIAIYVVVVWRLDTVQAATHLPKCTVLQPGRSQYKRSPLGNLHLFSTFRSRLS